MHTEMSNFRPRPGLMVIFCCLIQAFGGGVGWSSLPPIMPMVAGEISITHAMDGVIWGAVPLGVALLSLFAGAMVDRYGARIVGFVAVMGGGLACAARGMLHSAWAFAAVMFVFGVLTAFQSPTVPKVLAEHVPPGRLGRANAWTLLALTVAQGLVMLVTTPLLVPLFNGWRPFQMAAGAAMVVVALTWLILVRDHPRESEPLSLGSVLRLGANGQVVRLTLIFFLQFGGYVVLFGLLPRALAESGLAEGRIAVTVAVWLVTLGLFGFVGAWFSDSIGKRKPFVILGSVLCAGSLGALILVPVNASIFLLIAAGAGSGMFGSLLWAIAAEIPGIGHERVGAAIGFIMVFSQVGTFLLAVLTGFAADRGGLRAAFGLLAVAHLCILIPAKGLVETGRGSRREALCAGVALSAKEHSCNQGGSR